MELKKNEKGLIQKNNHKELIPSGKLKKLNELEFIDAFEILDIEEKLDFIPPGGLCLNIWCSGD